jgi:hypothetical protein
MTELLSDLRGAGLAMGTRYAPTAFTDPDTKEDHVSQLHVGYTTDEAKAEKAREAGATVTSCRATDRRFSGWGVTVRVIDL